MTDQESDPSQSAMRLERDAIAARNGELHVLCRHLLDKYRGLRPDDPLCFDAERRLTDVPQMRPGYGEAQ